MLFLAKVVVPVTTGIINRIRTIPCSCYPRIRHNASPAFFMDTSTC